MTRVEARKSWRRNAGCFGHAREGFKYLGTSAVHPFRERRIVDTIPTPPIRLRTYVNLLEANGVVVAGANGA